MKNLPPQPPFLVFPDREGGFLVFHDPIAQFAGPQVATAEDFARRVGGWVAGGLQYYQAEVPAPGWWGVFAQPDAVSWPELDAWADPGPVVTGPLTSPVGFEQYSRSFDLVRRALLEGQSYQANLTFPLEGRAVAGPPWSWRSALRLWLNLIAQQGREASFAVLGTSELPGPVLVSASPELFFAQDGQVVEARPMKGTGARHRDPALDAASRHELATSIKTRAENLMITDMLRNDLGRTAVPGGVSVPRLFEVEEYPTVWQMTSTVQGRFADAPSLSSLMATLFPCASITGAPKLRTQEVIAQAEGYSRGWYTGTLGWHRPGGPLAGAARSRFSVLIRTLVFDRVDDPRFHLAVGGGVVWDSTVEGEWAEAWAKARFLAPTERTFSLTEAILWTPEEGLTLLEEHLQRLGNSCLEFGGRLDRDALQASLRAEVERHLESEDVRPRKLRALVDPEFAITVESEALSPMPETLTGALAAHAFGPETLLWRRFKTTARAVYDDSKVSGVDQTIHFNERGELTESTTMTLVLEVDGRLVTPALECGLLDGTFRRRLLEDGQVEEGVVEVETLRRATRIWLVNSVRRWKCLQFGT